MFEDSLTDEERLNSYLQTSEKWAKLNVSISEIADDNKELIHDLRRFDPLTTIPLLSGLLTVPEYQTQCIRLEILVAVAITYCSGTKKPSLKELSYWYSKIGDSHCVIGEDPAEDSFVALVYDSERDYRILEGVWESSGFYTQRVLDIASIMPDAGKFKQIKEQFKALLLSDLVCDKSKLVRNQLGSDERKPSPPIRSPAEKTLYLASRFPRTN